MLAKTVELAARLEIVGPAEGEPALGPVGLADRWLSVRLVDGEPALESVLPTDDGRTESVESIIKELSLDRTIESTDVKLPEEPSLPGPVVDTAVDIVSLDVMVAPADAEV